MDFKFSIITGKDIQNIIKNNSTELFNVIKETYIDHSKNKTVNPNSYFLRFPDNKKARIIALPAAVNGENKISGIKWISSYPDNINHGFPRASAVIILNDYQTGYPIACLEGAMISATRTAYSAVLAAQYLHNDQKKIACLGLIGNGLIAKYIYNGFLSQGFEIGEIRLFDLDRKSSKTLQRSIENNFDGDVSIVGSYQELIKQSDLVVLATTAAEPYIDDISLFHKNQTILNISLRDLSPDILIHANNVVDDVEHVLSANTSPDLTYKKYDTKAFINGTIGNLMMENFFLDSEKPTIFSPMGMGVLDISMSYYIYGAQEKHQYVDDFFYEIER